MVIEFLCPNGHKIHCPEEHAGKAAKCPQCGAKFKIPAASEEPESPKPAAKSAPRQPKEPQIEFLCPNGHRLHGPASLQGRPGLCPECGSKFRIPSYAEDVSDEEQIEERIAVGGVDAAGSGVNLDATAEEVDKDFSYQLDLGDLSGSTVTKSPSALGKMLPWPALLNRLWNNRGPGVVMEVFLSEGEPLLPQQFAASREGEHGLFAVKNTNGTYTVTAIPWDAIRRVAVRGLKRLPDDIFGK